MASNIKEVLVQRCWQEPPQITLEACQACWDAAVKHTEEKLTSDNKDYAAALKVLDEYAETFRKAQQYEHIYKWVNKRLNSTS